MPQRPIQDATVTKGGSINRVTGVTQSHSPTFSNSYIVIRYYSCSAAPIQEKKRGR